MELLPHIQGPDDLKRLSREDLPRLAAEIRKVIIETVAKTGGHLAPSLGVVELTLALHYVFEAPKDRIIWDVGHQAYAHKLVTGRYDRFHTLRQHGGISGFPKRSESPYDVLDTGHSSTSISAALGMTTALDLSGQEGRVVAVIGDGSMTAGLAFEALNNAGHLRKDLVVILNDNEMSISPNVGALSSFLSRKLTGRLATRFKREMESFLKKSGVGEQIWSVLKRSEDSLKSLLTPGMLFEALQFEYVGPLPGHHLDTLIDTLDNVRNLEGPVLVHVLTKKGKGYPPAEKEPDRFHGIGPFDPATGEPRRPERPAPPTYTQIFSQTLLRLAMDDPRIVAITAAMPAGTGLSAFADALPHRFFDVGIAEQHAVTFAAGLAMEGLRPVVAVYSTFLQRAYDQVVHDVCLTGQPVVFALDRGGLVGDDGPTHHGAFDLSFLRAVPNLVIMAPKDENELQHMLYTALNHPGPVAVRYPRGAGVGVSLDWRLEALPVGRGEVLREGNDVAIVAIGSGVAPALEAAEALAAEGIEATVVNARFAKPIDADLVTEAARRTGRVVTVEENALAGGFGTAVLECLADRGLTGVRVRRLGLPDRFVEQGAQATLRRELGIDAEGIRAAAEALAAEGRRTGAAARLRPVRSG
ncbi:1-deoxy-D-xylulose-5-phosphate synthase [Dissulfurirhabdus thermomarina]|uniref:1-deoxy-D-xylulose-5-phosphate synthase n=1 Tax=Dissulfurirhabdus thermomarina TaxID=1765737 RepID=A0A6N9TPW2_DISTH|nr:1-deoxy-D-xylulose-5-phosphate synthase [Dissulfurirhabdus thermomarina]NDY42143.1 1-deoxy-D-xylulose-5-phosphate synthase [Dissulfurirhabdus thermomarina]NMX23077.1 1-deoxy-D-xylulose-5-phosphate synthase [Dissulfurirhabdus thermomarina]